MRCGNGGKDGHLFRSSPHDIYSLKIYLYRVYIESFIVCSYILCTIGFDVFSFAQYVSNTHHPFLSLRFLHLSKTQRCNVSIKMARKWNVPIHTDLGNAKNTSASLKSISSTSFSSKYILRIDSKTKVILSCPTILLSSSLPNPSTKDILVRHFWIRSLHCTVYRKRRERMKTMLS